MSTGESVRRALLADLARHRPADEKERRDLEAIVALVEGIKGCFSRSHFDPGHLTASAFILDLSSGKVLLHHHRRLDRWLQMGGHLDPGETPVEAALREAREESGLGELELPLSSPFDVDVHPIPAGKGEPAHLHFDLRWIAATRDPAGIAADLSESFDLRWFDLRGAETRVADPASVRALRKLPRLAMSL